MTKEWTKQEAIKWLTNHNRKHSHYESKANYHSFRQNDPGKYTSFRIQKKENGIIFVIGFKRGGGSEIQSIRFYHGGTKLEVKKVPYRSTAELPPAVKNNLPAAAQRAWMKAFNRAYEQYHSDQAAARVAWSVVRRLYRKVGDKWVKK